MAVVEGQGIIAPKPIEIPMEKSELVCLRGGAEDRAKFRKYSQRTDVWGKGLIRGQMIDAIGGGEIRAAVMPILVGLVGEYALCRYVNGCFKRDVCRIDLLLKPGGDGGKDFGIAGMRLDVKTRKRHSNKNHIRYGRLAADGYVFCQWELDYRALILGWASRLDVQSKWTVERSKFGHMNYVAEDSDLQPMSRLIAELHARQNLGGQ